MAKQIKIRAFSNWASSFALHDKIIDQFMGPKQLRDTLLFVTDDSYDYAVVFDHKGEANITVPKERTIGLITTAPKSGHYDAFLEDYCCEIYTCADPKEYALTSNVKYLPLGVFYGLDGEIEDYAFSSQKKYKLATVLSPSAGENHLNIAKAIALTGIGSVYGNGLNFKGIKGELSNKASGLIPFEFALCMESGIWDGYMSCEILDAVLCSCIPIYVGASNVLNYIPFAIPLVRYDNPKAAVKEIKDILAATKHEDVYPLILSWKKKYLTNFNLYEKIKEFVCRKPLIL